MQMGVVDEDEDKTTIATECLSNVDEILGDTMDNAPVPPSKPQAAPPMMPPPPVSRDRGIPAPIKRKHHNVEELEGEKISDRYLVLRRVGKGGMGVVYLAQQTNLNRDVCIKVLNPALIDDESAVVRFEREARGLSRLQHPNIVTIFDYGRDEDLAYIVMEYAQGETLSKYIKRESPLHIDSFITIAVQILKGIGEAHKLGLIHRDIKPANIMLCELEGQPNFVKILDFGLAKLAQGQEDVTKEQQLVGSASYMAPEQILQGLSDARTDVYALGVMFYQMLAGKKPFVGPNDNIILYKHVNEQPAPLSGLLKHDQEVPDTLCRVIEQALSKDPNKRPQTASAFLDAISEALEAPQLSKSFSSVNLGMMDKRRMAEEGETHAISPDARPASAHLSVDMQPGNASAQPKFAINADADKDPSHVTGNQNAQLAQGNALVQPNVAPLKPAAKSDARFFVIIGFLVVVALGILGIMIYFGHASDGEKPQVASVSEDATSSDQAKNSDDSDNYFAQIESSIDEGSLDQAQNLLDMFKNKKDRETGVAVDTRIASLQNRIECEKNNLKADNLLKNDQLDEARALYEQILSSDKNNEHAQKALDDLMHIALIKLDYSALSGVSFMTVLDENTVDADIVSQRITPGTHKIVVSAEGYNPFEESFSVDGGAEKTIAVKLEKKKSKATGGSSGSSNSGGSVFIGGGKSGGKGGDKKRQPGLL